MHLDLLHGYLTSLYTLSQKHQWYSVICQRPLIEFKERTMWRRIS
jgi:hypothetical protein